MAKHRVGNDGQETDNVKMLRAKDIEKPKAMSREVVSVPVEDLNKIPDRQKRPASEGPERGRKLRRYDWNPD
eukprot:13776645-Heterocapsa_arctica.AAC.1